jgi:hypothetical protein
MSSAGEYGTASSTKTLGHAGFCRDHQGYLGENEANFGRFVLKTISISIKSL